MIEFEKQHEVAEWLGTGSVNFFGMPLAGKDSQARRIGARFDGVTLGGGDILRNSVIPPEVKALMEAGRLVPTQDYVDIVLPYLSDPKFADKALFLSAVGRWKGEETSVQDALEQANHPLKMVVHLTVDAAEVRERLRREDIQAHRGNRIDDDLEIIDHRIEEFQTKTLPVIEHYKEQGLVVEVDASRPKEEVECAILGALAVRAGVEVMPRIVPDETAEA